jgi:MSHA pilin protein MshC
MIENHEKRSKRNGYTLVELTATLVVIGILAAFVMPRLAGRAGFESRGFYDAAQSVVRYAQKIAIAQRQSAPKTPVYVIITANQIRACYDALCTAAVTDPSSGGALSVTAPTGVTLAPITTFSFNGAGAPSLGAPLTVNVNGTQTGDISRTFLVESGTGYVHN